MLVSSAIVGKQSKCGKSPLHMAEENGHKDVWKLLLGYNADVIKKYNYGFNSFHLGAQSSPVRTSMRWLKYCHKQKR